MEHVPNGRRSVPCAACPLRRMSAFRPFSEEELRRVSAWRRRQISRPAGASLLVPGPAGETFFTLFSGWAFRYIRLADGNRQILEFLLPGDLFGVPAVVVGHWDYGVTALTKVTLCAIDAHALDEMFTTHPDMVKALMRTIIEHRRRADDRLAVLGRTQGPQRIAHLMLETFERLEALAMTEGNRCAFPLRRRHIADATGLSGSHVNRSLDDLDRRNLARIGNGVLTIADRERLATFAGYVSPDYRFQRLLV